MHLIRYAIGSILSQKTDDITLCPISFASQRLDKAELNYSTIEKELLAIIWSTKQFRPYLYGRSFIIETDHKPLLWLFKSMTLGLDLFVAVLFLSDYTSVVCLKHKRVASSLSFLGIRPLSLSLPI
jgi:hypothetical protein